MGYIDEIKDKNRIITQADYEVIKSRLLMGDILLIHNKDQDFVYPHQLVAVHPEHQFPIEYSVGERIVLPDCTENIIFSSKYDWFAYLYNDMAIIPNHIYGITMEEFENLYKKCKRYHGFR